MVLPPRRNVLRLLAAALVAVLMVGCGGGGKPAEAPAARTTPLKIDIAWSARSRAANAPASALSATIRLARGGDNDSPVTFPAVDRSDVPGEYTQNYVSPTPVRTGSNLVTITFHADKDGKGAVVGVASKSFLIGSDGTGAGEIATVGKVQKVVASGPESLAVGASGALSFSARDGNDRTIAVSPGSARFAARAGASSLAVTEDGQATGLAVGTATVTATVDSVESEPVAVSVTAPDGAKAVIAAGQSVTVGETRPLVHAVTDADGNPVPVDPAQRVFDVRAGAENIAIDANGQIQGIKVGTATVVLKIGDSLESAPATVTVRPSSTSINVVVAPQQNVAVGETKTLAFTATDADGNALPLGAGGVRFDIVSGASLLTLGADGTATGTAPGVAVVTATVDGKTSAPQSVLVGTIVTTASGLKYIDIQTGTGGLPETGQQATVHYTGTLLDGTKFDSSRDRNQPFVFRVGTGQVIAGFDEGVGSLRAGGKRLLVIPSTLGYGAQGAGAIPPNATLLFDIELLRIDP